MSKGMLIKRANQRPTLQYLKSDMMIVIMNSWAMFNKQIMFNMAQQGKWRERDFWGYDAEGIIAEKEQLYRDMCKEYEGNFRIMVCIAKHKPRSEWSPKPKRPDKPYKNFFEYVNKMKTALLERHEKFVWANKLQVGDVIPMYDGPYVVKEAFREEGGDAGYVVIFKENMNDKLHSWKIQWTINVPRFYGITRRVDVQQTGEREFHNDSYINTVDHEDDITLNVGIDEVNRGIPSFRVSIISQKMKTYYDFSLSMVSDEIFRDWYKEDDKYYSDPDEECLNKVRAYLTEKVDNDKVFTNWDMMKFQWNCINGYINYTQLVDYWDGKLDAYHEEKDYIESNVEIPIKWEV